MKNEYELISLTQEADSLWECIIQDPKGNQTSLKWHTSASSQEIFARADNIVNRMQLEYTGEARKAKSHWRGMAALPDKTNLARLKAHNKAQIEEMKARRKRSGKG